MTTLTDLRSAVHIQTQTDEADLSNGTIDLYLQQAFERTMNAESRWPFYASTWALTQNIDEAWLTLPGDVSVPGIDALIDDLTGYRMGMVPQVWADDRFRGNNTGSTHPMMFSVWGDRVMLWPSVTYTDARQYTLRGYRRPLNWLTIDGVPDCDQRLHLPLTHYAVALAYAQQEDDVLEATYMARWQADVELARRQIMEPAHHRPLVGAGSIGVPVTYPVPGWVIAPPAGP